MTASQHLSRRIAPFVAVAALGALLSGCSVLQGIIGGTDIPEGETDAFAIEIGDCLNDAEISTEVSSVPLVECSEPHDSEVYALTDTTTADFPGDAALSAELDAFCQGEAFTEFVGIPYADSMYNTSGYFPSDESWAAGDRELLCTIYDPNGRVTGSLAGVAQ